MIATSRVCWDCVRACAHSYCCCSEYIRSYQTVQFHPRYYLCQREAENINYKMAGRRGFFEEVFLVAAGSLAVVFICLVNAFEFKGLVISDSKRFLFKHETFETLVLGFEY